MTITNDKTKQNKFLTEAMGWYEEDNAWVNPEDPDNDYWTMPHFSTWEGFGKLWEWAQKQEWFKDFFDHEGLNFVSVWLEFIHPDKFADAVYKYLNDRDNGYDHEGKKICVGCDMNLYHFIC